MAGYHNLGYALLGASKKVYTHVLTRINSHHEVEFRQVIKRAIESYRSARKIDIQGSRERVLAALNASEAFSWENMNFSKVKSVFSPYEAVIASFLEITENLSQNEFVKLDRFYCDGMSLAHMLNLFRAVIGNDIEYYNEKVKPCIRAELEKGNYYNEVTQFIWKEYLQDVLDVLGQWGRGGEKERLQIILGGCQ